MQQRLSNEGDKYRVIEQGAFTRIQFLAWGPEPLYDAPVTQVIVKTDELLHPLKESNAPYFAFFGRYLKERYGGAEELSASGELSERVAPTIRRGLKAG